MMNFGWEETEQRMTVRKDQHLRLGLSVLPEAGMDFTQADHFTVMAYLRRIAIFCAGSVTVNNVRNATLHTPSREFVV